MSMLYLFELYFLLTAIFTSFAFQEYFRKHQCKSVLCMPIIYQNSLVGALYMENNSFPKGNKKTKTKTTTEKAKWGSHFLSIIMMRYIKIMVYII